MSLKTISRQCIFGLLIAPLLVQAQTGTFTSFEIRPGLEKTVEINWKMRPAADTLLLIVEKSMDEKNWRAIGSIGLRSSHVYSFTDSRPLTGRNYYRIVQVDTMKSRVASTPVQWLRFNQSAGFFIWPNPAKDVLHLRTDFINGSVDVIDTGGKHLFKVVITNSITDIPVAGLSKGLYILNIRNEDLVFVEKFVKE